MLQLSLKDKPKLAQAFARATNDQLECWPMLMTEDGGSFLVTSSNHQTIYTVILAHQGRDDWRAECGCRAAANGLICKHIALAGRRLKQYLDSLVQEAPLDKSDAAFAICECGAEMDLGLQLCAECQELFDESLLERLESMVA